MPEPAVVEARAVGWLGRAGGYFDPDTYAPGDRAGRMAARKGLADLAGLLLCRGRLPAADAPGYADLVDLVAGVAARRSYRDLIARAPRLLWLHGLVYAALRVWGRDDPELRWMIEQAVAARHPVSWERLPYRYLDYLNFLEAGNIAHDLRPFEDAYRSTLLAAVPNVALLGEEDAYAITHTVFYMSDYGGGARRWPADVDTAVVAELVDALLRRHRIGRHLDLVAELLICTACLGTAASTQAQLGWRVLGRAQSATGAVAAPAHLVEGTVRAARDDEGYREWRQCYHTTVMTALAALLTVHTEGRPPAPVSRRPAGIAPPRAGCESVERAARWLCARVSGNPLREAVTAAAGLCAAVPPGPAGSPVLRSLTVLTRRLEGAELRPRERDQPGAELLPALLSTLGEAGLRAAALEALAPRPPSAPAASPPAGALTGIGSETAIGLAGWALDPARGRRRGEVLDQLTFALLEAVEHYRLGDAAVLLRVLALAGEAEDRAVRDSVAALIAQQREDGSFGYPAADVVSPAIEQARLLWTARLAAGLACAGSAGRLEAARATERRWRAMAR